MSRKARDLSRRRYVYKLDAAGQWSYGRNRVDDPELARQFFRDIYLEGGSYKLECEGEICDVRVAGTPSFVDEVALETREGRLEAVTLTLASGAREALDPASLETAGDGALVCTDSRGLKSKFRRRPHLELAKFIRESGDGRYLIEVKGTAFEVRAAKDGAP